MSVPQTTPHAADACRSLTRAARLAGDAQIVQAAVLVESALDVVATEHRQLEANLAQATAGVQLEKHKFETFARACITLHASIEPDTVFERIFDAACDVFHAERGLLWIADTQTSDLKVARHFNVDSASIDVADWRFAREAAQEACETDRPYDVADTQEALTFAADSEVRRRGIRSYAALPLWGNAGQRGAMYFDSRVPPRDSASDRAQLLASFCVQARQALQNARAVGDTRTQLHMLAKRESVQERVLASLANGVITVDSDGRIATFNAAAAETFSVDAREVIGRPASALEMFLPRITSLLDSRDLLGRPIEMTALLPTRGNVRVSVRIALFETESGYGTQSNIAIAITDITERRPLETSRQSEIEGRHAIGDAFTRYLAPHVVDQLMKSPSAVELGGERNIATILFADIRDFTKMAARLEAERVVEILNTYFESAVSVLFEHDGLLDKFYGDGLMAVFGPPRVRADDAARALRSAARLHEVVRELEPIISEPLRISVGLATGEVVAGHIGSTRRLDYTVIGDAVNLASRLQSAAPPNATYCDEATYQRSGLELSGERLQAKIKGRDDLVTVYRLT